MALQGMKTLLIVIELQLSLSHFIIHYLNELRIFL